MTVSFTIGGVSKDIQPGWRINAVTNGRNTMTFKVTSLDGSYKPSIDDEVIFTVDGTRIFGGNIIRPTTKGLGDYGGTPIETDVNVEDFNKLTQRRFYTGDLASQSLKADLQAVVSYIPGVTLDAGQVTGPTMPALSYTNVRVEDVLNDFTLQSGGYLWNIDYYKTLSMVIPGSPNAPFNISVPNCKAIGDVTVEPTRNGYANRVIVKNASLQSQADDATEQSAHGIWEELYSAPDTMDQTSLDALAATILSISIITLNKVQYRTITPGLFPGQVQTITLSARGLSGSFLITDITISDVGNTLSYDVTALEGLIYRTGWRETWRNVLTGTGKSISGFAIGGITSVRFAYFLGGSEQGYVDSPTPTWVALSPLEVQINTIPRGTTSALVTGKLRVLDSGNTVQARIYDVTAGSACTGTSSSVNSTTWTAIQFTTTLTPGSHYYRIEVLPGLANAGVAGMAYLE